LMTVGSDRMFQTAVSHDALSNPRFFERLLLRVFFSEPARWPFFVFGCSLRRSCLCTPYNPSSSSRSLEIRWVALRATAGILHRAQVAAGHASNRDQALILKASSR
jgi:hypothetical protein